MPPTDAEDPTELIQKALVALEPDFRTAIEALPPDEQRYGYGIALWLNGYSMAKAARLTEVNRTTLLLRIQNAQLTNSDRVNKLEAHEPLFHQIVQEGARQQLEKLAEGDASLAQLTVTTGVAADKVIKVHEMRNKKPEQAPDNIAEFFSQLQKRGVKRVSLEVETEDPAIDVTPEKKT